MASEILSGAVVEVITGSGKRQLCLVRRGPQRYDSLTFVGRLLDQRGFLGSERRIRVVCVIRVVDSGEESAKKVRAALNAESNRQAAPWIVKCDKGRK